MENDYLQHIALSSLYSEFSNELVFKGGTALQKVYGLNRLSRDLDFNLLNVQDPDPALRRMARKASAYYECDLGPPARIKHGVGYKLRIKGPSYTGAEHVLPLTFNLLEKVELEPSFKTINPGPVYKDPDMRVYSVFVMKEEEILAEKVRAVLTRKTLEPRDVYDIWFLLNKGIGFDMNMAKRKVESDSAVFSIGEFKKKIVELSEKEWHGDLSPLIHTLPDYKDVRARILSGL